MNPGKRLKLFRKEVRLTQKELGESLGIAWHKVKDIEAGKLRLSPDLAYQIEQKYSISMKWLLVGEGRMWLDEDGQGQGSGDERQGVDPRLEKALKMMQMMDDEAVDDVLKYIQKVKRMKEMEKKIRELEERIKVAGE